MYECEYNMEGWLATWYDPATQITSGRSFFRTQISLIG